MTEVITTSREKFVGQSVTRVEDERLSSGRGAFVDDIRPPNTLYCAILRSPYAHARILKVDASKAILHPKVRAVITGKEVMELSTAIPPYLGAPVLHYCLAVDKARFVGEPVAAVAATDKYAAVDALDLIDVEYEPIPVILDPEEAMAQNAPLVFDEIGTNIVWHKRFEFGSVESVFREAGVKFSFKLNLHRYSSTPLETFVCNSSYNRSTRELDIWCNTQQAGIMFSYLSRALRIPGNKIRVRVPPDVGGGFGIKCGGLPYICITGLLSVISGQPVNWVEERSQHMLAQGHSADGRFSIEVAANKEGILQGLKVKTVEGEGGYLTWASIYNVTKLAAINGNYHVQNIVYDGYAVATNKAPAVPNRAIGKKGMNLIIERAMDKLASEIGMDRIEVRRKNLIRKDEFPYPTPSGQIYDSSDYERLIDEAISLSRYYELKKMQYEGRKRGKYYGVGVVCGVEPGTVNFSYHSTGSEKPLRSGAAEGARVKLESTGKVTVMVGSVSNGQGHETSIAQVVADELCVKVSDINVIGEFDSFVSPWTVSSGVYSNKFSALDIGAVITATRKLKQKIVAIAAHLLHTSAERIVLEDGRIHEIMAYDKEVDLAEIADVAYNNLLFLPPGVDPGLEFVSFYSFPEANISTAKGKLRSFLTFASSVHVAFVEVDTETGAVSVIKYFVVDDFGNLINPKLVEGQVHGNVLAEIGAGLMEEMFYNEEGQLMTSTFVDYLKPTAKETVDIRTSFISTPSEFTILGTKSVGDGPAIPVLAVLASAVEDALTPFGALIDSFPLTPEKILGKIKGAG